MVPSWFPYENTIRKLQNAVFKCKSDRLLWIFSATIAYYMKLKITVFTYFWKIHKFSIFIWFQVVSHEKASEKTCQIMTSKVIFVISCEFYNIVCAIWHSIFWKFHFFWKHHKFRIFHFQLVFPWHQTCEHLTDDIFEHQFIRT